MVVLSIRLEELIELKCSPVFSRYFPKQHGIDGISTHDRIKQILNLGLAPNKFTLERRDKIPVLVDLFNRFIDFDVLIHFFLI